MVNSNEIDLTLNVEGNTASDEELQAMDRWAICPQCKALHSSSHSLAFYVYRGEGSSDAINICGKCGLKHSAHLPDNYSQLKMPHEFQAHGAFELDFYYCGCKGWD